MKEYVVINKQIIFYKKKFNAKSKIHALKQAEECLSPEEWEEDGSDSDFEVEILDDKREDK